jgi:hypothetical protein
MWMLDQYESHYAGWNVKHFHEHLQLSHGRPWSYSWVKTKLQAADLVPRMRRRGSPHRRHPGPLPRTFLHRPLRCPRPPAGQHADRKPGEVVLGAATGWPGKSLGARSHFAPATRAGPARALARHA